MNPEPSDSQSNSSDESLFTMALSGQELQTLADSVEAIGRYRLQHKLGSGGMGEVWAAEQSEPIQRQVAIKLIKRAIGNKEVIARFEAERQALAMMNHPNIARILDVGTSDAGQPFFVMELVEGQTLTTYCDENKLSIDERLRLFIDICSGVQHAHQKGIIHRDLKPGNILVSRQDGLAVPKIIDFGLAKAIESTQRLTDRSLFTEIGQVLGTLKYMSPEQASLDNLDIDTRADIYALGVILYELLTGSTPLEDSSIKEFAALKVLEFIREKDPVKPSSRLASSNDQQLSAITGQRQTNSVQLKRILLGDLDWIVMKALEKERTRRYESASGFAEDLRRYLSNEPVVARPPSLNYRVRKFVRKNRAAVLATMMIVLSLVAGIVGTTVSMFRALKAEELADTRFKQAEDARKQSEQNSNYIRKGNEILGSVFANLDPRAEYATVAEFRIRLQENLQEAIDALKTQEVGSPLATAELQHTIGKSLVGLGKPKLAIEILESAYATRCELLGADHIDTLETESRLAIALLHEGQMKAALPLLEANCERSKTQLGETHSTTLISTNNLAVGYLHSGQFDMAIAKLEPTIPKMKVTLGLENGDTLSAIANLAAALGGTQRFREAVSLTRESFELTKAKYGPNSMDTLRCMNNLAQFLCEVGEFDEAISVFTKALDTTKQILGFDHPNTLHIMNNLAVAYELYGKLDHAVLLYEEALLLRRRNSGNDHPDTLISMNNLAAGYRSVGRLEEAVPLLSEVATKSEITLGREHIRTQMTLGNLGRTYLELGRAAESIPLLEEVYASRKSNPILAKVRDDLAEAYAKVQRVEEFRSLATESIDSARAELPSKSPVLADLLVKFGSLYSLLALHPEAATLLREALEIRIESAPDQWTTFNTRSLLGGALVGQAQGKQNDEERSRLLQEAESYLVAGYEGLKSRAETIPPKAANRLSEALERVIEFYTSQGRVQEANQLRQSASQP